MLAAADIRGGVWRCLADHGHGHRMGVVACSVRNEIPCREKMSGEEMRTIRIMISIGGFGKYGWDGRAAACA
jgi:hypothetical protein